MKERPILFSTEMVKAILEGHKTQTRRVIRQGSKGNSYDYFAQNSKCLYGQLGDRLWVKETFSITQDDEEDSPNDFYITYRAGGVYAWRDNEGIYDYPLPEATWKPSIFMPRRFSRITLEIIGVKVERVQEITEEDALAEGANAGCILASPTILHKGLPGYTETPKDYRKGYCYLWDKINGKKYPWASNPWVWAITFKVVK